MNEEYTATKLKVGDVYCEKRGEIKSYRKVASIKKEKSKYAGAPEKVVYQYVKCDKSGSIKPTQTGICYASKVDELLACGEAELVLA